MKKIGEEIPPPPPVFPLSTGHATTYIYIYLILMTSTKITPTIPMSPSFHPFLVPFFGFELATSFKMHFHTYSNFCYSQFLWYQSPHEEYDLLFVTQGKCWLFHLVSKVLLLPWSLKLPTASCSRLLLFFSHVLRILIIATFLSNVLEILLLLHSGG